MPNAEGSSAPAPTGPRTFLRIEYVTLLATVSRVVDRGRLRRHFPKGKGTGRQASPGRRGFEGSVHPAYSAVVAAGCQGGANNATRKD